MSLACNDYDEHHCKENNYYRYEPIPTHSDRLKIIDMNMFEELKAWADKWHIPYEISEYEDCLYITFDIEINANVSTIESLLMHAGQDIPLFDEEIDKIIRDSDKYQLYFDIFNYFNNNPHYTQDDANYIISKLGNKQTIEKIIKKILKKCKHFFMKVEKNKLNYIENRKK